MTSPYSVYPYRLWGRVKKTSVAWGREFQTYVCCISFWRKKKKQTKNKTKQNKKQKKKKKELLEVTNRVAGVNLLCSPQNKILGNKFLRPQLTLLSHGFGYTPGTTYSPSPLGQNLDNEFLREHLLSSYKFVYHNCSLFYPSFRFLCILLCSDQVLYKRFLDFYGF